MNVPDAVRATDPGAGQEPDEEPDARPEGPAPDPDEGIEEIPEVEELDNDSSGGLIGRISDWATSTPSGSYRDVDARDFWDPEGGGKNRIAFHLKDLIGSGDIPNGLGTLLGGAELYYNLATEGGSRSSADNDSADGFPEIEGAAPGGEV